MYGLIVRLLGTTGMRVGELAGLNVGDVHILGSRGYVDVRRTYDARYGLSESPKTDRSNRTVTLVPDVVPLMAAYLAEHPRLRESDAPLFMSRVVGGAYMSDWKHKPAHNPRHVPSDEDRPFDPTRRFDGAAFYRRVWVRSVEMAGVAPLRIHDLRHTAPSFMLSSGMPITMVSRQLGHSSTSTTDLIYGGLLRNSLDEAVDLYGEWLSAQGSRRMDPRRA
jgi:integrase